MKKLFYIVGTNGSGKSSIAKYFIANSEKSYIDFPEYRNHAIVLKNFGLIVLGKYPETAKCGGCDTIRTKAFRHGMLQGVWHEDFDIMMEGILIPNYINIVEIQNEININREREIYIIHMNPPLDVCFRRIKERNGKAQSDLKRNGETVISKHKGCSNFVKSVKAKRYSNVKFITFDDSFMATEDMCRVLINV